jgi:hypothetical protein
MVYYVKMASTMGLIQVCNHMSEIMKVMFWWSAPNGHPLVFVSLLLMGELIRVCLHQVLWPLLFLSSWFIFCLMTS